MRRIFLNILIILCSSQLLGQTLGGSNAYNFLRFPASPQLAALGGLNVAHQSNDLSLAFQNPAQLDSSMHAQMVANFNSLYDGVKNYHWMMAYRNKHLKTNFAASVFYFNYGNITQTDAAGNILGALRPRDFVVQISASRRYLEKWNYGISAKYISSNYGQFRSNAVAADVGVLYKDSAKLVQIGLVAMNMGGQIKRYNPNVPEELPFDVVFGIFKQLEKAPIRFSLTAHHLNQFDILYNDTTFNNNNGFRNPAAGKFTFEKLFQHFIFSTQLLIGQRVEVTVGYNYLRRSELRITNVPNGLTGFSLGVGAILPKLQLRYARSYFQNSTAYNQLGINLPLNQYFGLGKFGEKIGW
ncbi:MAG: type IX secretion system protein PorQ [Chitinophagaceae bacterium]|nr:type IX secretion system protein PorQ [Chitinophagaceae bacterium]